MSTRLTIPEAAAELRCSERTVRRAIKRGDLPAVLFGGKYLIQETDLPAALPDRSSPPPLRRPGQVGEASALARRIAGAA